MINRTISADETLYFDIEEYLSSMDALDDSCISLEDAGLEEDTRYQPIFGNTDSLKQASCASFMNKCHASGSVFEYQAWFYDNESDWEDS